MQFRFSSPQVSFCDIVFDLKTNIIRFVSRKASRLPTYPILITVESFMTLK